MKRSLLILVVLLGLVCGCQNDKKADEVKQPNSTTFSTTTTASTTKTSTSKKTTTTKKTTTVKKCQAKKFNKKYTYAYKTEAECKKKGNEAFLYVSDNINKDIFVYSCRAVKDECGDTWYGVFYYVYNHKTSKEEEFYY